MLGRNDDCWENFNDKELVSELEIFNLLTIATNDRLNSAISNEDYKKLKDILSFYAKEKIDRMAYQISEFKKSEENSKPRI